MEQKKKVIPKNKMVTSEGDLKRFTRQLENKNMTDEQFRKAYERFKRPSYYQTMGERKDGE
jgi:hypothetical protein